MAGVEQQTTRGARKVRAEGVRGTVAMSSSTGARTTAVLFLVACGRDPSPADPSSPNGASSISEGAASGSASTPMASPTTPPAPAAPASGTPPIGSPKFCPGDDATGMPLATSPFVSQLPIADARFELEGMNEICGDTWCEGGFEWFFYDLRGDKDKSEITMRVYDDHKGSKGDATKVVVQGPGYVGRVLAQKVVSSCTTPCEGFTTPPRYEPCLTLDLRCELTTPWSRASQAIDCGLALEDAVRAIHPEF
jgi:hypothetical protein